MKSRIRNLIKRVPLLGKPYIQRDELRAIVQKLWEPPGQPEHFSPIPDQSEVRKHVDRIFDASSRHVPDVELNEEAQPLPRLRRGVYVHFHDIFYPFEYSKEWVYQGRE